MPAASSAQNPHGDGPTASKKKHSPGDFRVSVLRLAGTSDTRQVNLRLRVTNTRPWTATSVHVCAAVPRKRARVVGVSHHGSIRYKGKSACWIVRKLKRGRSLTVPIEVRLAHPPGRHRNLKRITVTVTGGNSNPLSHRYALVAAPRKRAHQARASSIPCAAPHTLGITFVTDDSESMEISDPSHLRAKAIAVGLDQMPDGSLAAATSFNEFSGEMFGVTTVSGTTRPGLKTAAQQLFDFGGTNYQEAFLGAQTELAAMSGADKKAVVFLSDGAPNSLEFNANEAIAAAGTAIYTIGLGVSGFPEAEGILAGIAAGSGGQYYSATSAGQIQSIFARIIASLTCGAQNISETFPLAPGESRSIPFTVEPSDSDFRALAAWSEGHVTVTAQRPDGSTMSAASLRSGEGYVNESTYALLTGGNPLIGPWQLIVTADTGNLNKVDVTIDVFRRGLPDPPPLAPAPGRHPDPCTTAYPNFSPKTSKAFGGKQTLYDRSESLYFVCAGFGAPEDLKLSPEMQCALIAAGATFGGPALAVRADAACNVVAFADAYRSGDWLGLTAGQACGYFSDVFAGAVGVVAAGAAAETGPGAVSVGLFTYRALAAGLKVACGGLLDGGASALGIKLEADHETHIALDVLRKGRCIKLREFAGALQWSAIECK
ncbi:MAG TPA: vWA domain-containing protein [Solirubrobacterales bacterium]